MKKIWRKEVASAVFWFVSIASTGMASKAKGKDSDIVVYVAMHKLSSKGMHGRCQTKADVEAEITTIEKSFGNKTTLELKLLVDSSYSTPGSYHAT
jgi:hypothetical protein